MQTLLDTMMVAIEAKRSGRQEEMAVAQKNFDQAFTHAVAKAMTELFHKEAQTPSFSFRDAVRKAINPNQIFS